MECIICHNAPEHKPGTFYCYECLETMTRLIPEWHEIHERLVREHKAHIRTTELKDTQEDK